MSPRAASLTTAQLNACNYISGLETTALHLVYITYTRDEVLHGAINT
jgi:hypothetical protein